VFLGEAAYNYRLTDGSSIISYGSDPKDYSTDVLAAKAADFVRGTHGQPFLLFVAFHAPHDEGAFPPIPAPRAPEHVREPASAEAAELGRGGCVGQASVNPAPAPRHRPARLRRPPAPGRREERSRAARPAPGVAGHRRSGRAYPRRRGRERADGQHGRDLHLGQRPLLGGASLDREGVSVRGVPARAARDPVPAARSRKAAGRAHGSQHRSGAHDRRSGPRPRRSGNRRTEPRAASPAIRRSLARGVPVRVLRESRGRSRRASPASGPSGGS
jgi:hypothetical protein